MGLRDINVANFHTMKLASKIFSLIVEVSSTNHAHMMCAIKVTSKFKCMILGMYFTSYHHHSINLDFAQSTYVKR